MPKIVGWYIQGKIQIDPMITHVMPLAEINNAFELMKRGESMIRGVVRFSTPISCPGCCAARRPCVVVRC